MLYGDLHVQQALALVAASEAYSEVLLLEAEPRVEGHADVMTDNIMSDSHLGENIN